MEPVIDDRRMLLAASPLARAGGLLVTRLADPEVIAELAAEASQTDVGAQRFEIAEAPAGGELRGQPDRAITTSIGGPVLAHLFNHPATLALLAALTGLAWRPLGEQGTYSFYGQGDHLGTHRDAPGCDLAVITCVHDDGDTDAPGGDLVAYPGRSADTIAAIRAEPERGAHRVRLEPGQTAILLGGIVPHLVSTIEGHRLRVVAPLCYTLDTTTPVAGLTSVRSPCLPAP